MTIQSISRPEGQSLDYQFFQNMVTGNRFKVKLSATDAAPVRLENGAAANPQFGVCITTSMIDENNHAMTENGAALVDSFTHTFTAVETADPEFSVGARVTLMLSDRIAALETQRAARASLNDIQSAWSTDAINLNGV